MCTRHLWLVEWQWACNHTSTSAHTILLPHTNTTIRNHPLCRSSIGWTVLKTHA